MTSVYCSLADAKEELRADDVLDTAQDRKLMRLIRQFSRRIDAELHVDRPLFVPVIENRDVSINGGNINSAQQTLTLNTTAGGPSPLLDFTSATINGSALAIGTNVQAFPTGLSPIMMLQLLQCRTWWDYITCAGCGGSTLATIGGVWGFHRNYDSAWLDVDTLDGAIDASVKTITVIDIGGATDYDETPRISAGNVLQIDEEWLDVVATDTTTNTATVIRGVNGSTAAAHDDEAVVSVFQWDDNVRRATARQSALMYARQGAFNTARVSQYTNADFPEDVLQEVWALIQPYANM